MQNNTTIIPDSEVFITNKLLEADSKEPTPLSTSRTAIFRILGDNKGVKIINGISERALAQSLALCRKLDADNEYAIITP